MIEYLYWYLFIGIWFGIGNGAYSTSLNKGWILKVIAAIAGFIVGVVVWPLFIVLILFKVALS